MRRKMNTHMEVWGSPQVGTKQGSERVGVGGGGEMSHDGDGGGCCC